MKRKNKRKKMLESYSLIFPNLFTTGNLYCGFFSIVSSLKGNYVMAAYMVLAAALFDLMDGKVARWVNGVSNFGKEYDSLSDLVSFGVAPAILAYLWTLSSIPRLGWLAAFLFVACGALRLARFNVIYSNADPRYFLGLPIPVAAGTIVSAVLFFNELNIESEKNYVFLILMFLMSFFMVSALKYKSYKKSTIVVNNEFFANMVLFVLILIIVAFKPEVMLLILFSLYIMQGLFISALEKIKLLSKKPVVTDQQVHTKEQD